MACITNARIAAAILADIKPLLLINAKSERALPESPPGKRGGLNCKSHGDLFRLFAFYRLQKARKDEVHHFVGEILGRKFKIGLGDCGIEEKVFLAIVGNFNF